MLLDRVAAACDDLAVATSGRVMTVPSYGIESALAAAEARGERFDTIVSCMRTPAVAEVSGYVAALERILSPEGWIHMVEPAAGRPGDPSTDVVTALRSQGLVVTDLYRRREPSVPAAWRNYVVLRARRATTPEGRL